MADLLPKITTRREVYTVSRLNLEARALLEKGFPLLWIEGEISNLAQPASGHIYFTLKDPYAQVRCAMFKNRKRLLGFKPKNGQQVMARVRVSLYEGRGEYQLLAEHLEEAGEGDLRRAFEALKNKLQAEGLFDSERKQTIPSPPRQLGIITSPSGAAVRDVLTVLKRRHAGLPTVIYPVAVQGDAAAPAIVQAIATANRRKECDLLLLTRGGGSIEDLWAFNEELVARAIAASKIPVVSAIGHEIDFTIADFVADLRAPTPSAAAELISPDGEQLRDNVTRLKRRLGSAIRAELTAHTQQLALLSQRLEHQHPGRLIQERAQRIDDLEQHLQLAIQQRLEGKRHHIDHLRQRLKNGDPRQRIANLASRNRQLGIRLSHGMEHRLQQLQNRYHNLTHNLNTVSPLATLGRGYAIVSHDADNTIIRHSDQVAVGDRINARLGHGTLQCKVETKHDETVDDN